MLTCKEVSQRASALIDGELSLLETWQMRMHLALCKGCAQFVGQLRVTRDLSSAVPFQTALDTSDKQNIDALMSRLSTHE